MCTHKKLCSIFFFLFVKFENSLRRHNHIGLVQALLLSLAKAGRLSTAEEGARKAMKDRIEQRKARGEDMDED